MQRIQELVRLHRMGTGAREVARMLHMSPNTERDHRYALRAEGLLEGTVEEIAAPEVLRAVVERHLPLVAPPQMVSTLEPAVRDKIAELATKGLKPQAIYDRLRLEDSSFEASFWSVRGAWRKWRKARGVCAEDGAIPVETEPGEVAQVDFGYIGKSTMPRKGSYARRGVFVMVLAFSRRADLPGLAIEAVRHVPRRCPGSAFKAPSVASLPCTASQATWHPGVLSAQQFSVAPKREDPNFRSLVTCSSFSDQRCLVAEA